MTEEQINRLQSLLDAGTQGEWTSTRWTIRCNGKWIGEIAPDGNAELVVALHNLAPALLEAARENLRLRKVAKGVLDLIDPAVHCENDLYGDSKEENAKYRALREDALEALSDR